MYLFSSTYDIVVQNGTSYLDYFKQATEKTNKNGWKVSNEILHLSLQI